MKASHLGLRADRLRRRGFHSSHDHTAHLPSRCSLVLVLSSLEKQAMGKKKGSKGGKKGKVKDPQVVAKEWNEKLV